MNHIFSVFLVFTICSLGSCAKDKAIPDKGPRVVAVVGGGVKSTRKPQHKAPNVKFAEGEAVWLGAITALEESERLQDVEDKIKLVGYDDGASEKEAMLIARELADDPMVLAVIGHGTSQTTQNAAEIYREAGIPLLVPIATSPKAVEDSNGDRLKNCIRLIPSDDRVQGPAMDYVVRNKFPNVERIVLLKDVSADASVYSTPLYDYLSESLGGLIIEPMDVDQNGGQLSEDAKTILSRRADLIVLCGYGSTMGNLLTRLEDTYLKSEASGATKRSERPKILCSDGCKNREFTAGMPYGFDIYITFPLKPITSYQDEDRTADNLLLSAKIADPDFATYEIYGYDAMLLVAKGMNSLSENSVALSRPALRAALEEVTSLKGVTSTYTFRAGENARCQYYVFGSTPSSGDGSFRLIWELTPDQIIPE